MGQYANQPDFITSAKTITPTATINLSTKLNAASLWVGTGGNITVIIAGATGASGKGLPTSNEAVVFKGIPDGTYLPVIVDYVLPTTTGPASDIVACH